MADTKPPPPPYRKPVAGKPADRRPARTKPATIDVDQIDRNIEQTARKQVTKALKDNPELVLSIIRGWKKGDR